MGIENGQPASGRGQQRIFRRRVTPCEGVGVGRWISSALTLLLLGTANLTITAQTVTPVINWANPAAITYGTLLSATQLNATATYNGTAVAGTFAYSPAAGSEPTAGAQTLSVTFTPTNTTQYSTATATATLTVNKATPAIVWGTPAPIPYGTALSSTQLDASAALAPNTTILPTTSVQSAQTVVLSTAPLPTGVLQSCSTYYAQAPSAGQSLTFVILNSNGSWNYTIVNSFTVTATANAGFQTFTAPPIAITAGQVVGFWAASGTAPGLNNQTAEGFYLNNQTTLPSGPTGYTSWAGGYPVSCKVASNMATPNISVPAPTATTSAQTLILSDAPLPSGVLQSCSANYYSAPAAGQSLTFVIFSPNGNSTGTYNDGTTTGSYTITNSFTVTPASSAGPQTFTSPPIAITAGQRVGFWAASGTEPGIYQAQDAFGSFFLNGVTTLPSGPTTYTAYHGDYPVACVVSGGQFTYNPPAGTVPAVGTDSLSVTFTPTDTADYTSATSTVLLTVNKATPVITWATPAPIPYGTALTATQLDASVSTTPNINISAPANIQSVSAVVLSNAALPSGTLQSCTTYYNQVPAAGQSLTFLIFNANGGNSFTIANSFTVTVSASSGMQTFTAPPIVITAGQVVGYWTASGTEPGYGNQSVGGYYINSEATLPSGPQSYSGYGGGYPVSCKVAAGQFTYNPPAGTVPAVGTDTLSVTYTPTNTTDYSTATASVNLTVSQTTPTVTWPTPAPIAYGTALSGVQLDATASVPGTFAYSPVAGTVPATGTDTLSVTFTPTSSAYSTVTKTVSLTVLSSISDTGTVTLTVGGVTAATTTYGANATPISIASGLSSGVTAGSFVNVTAVNDGLYLVAKQSGLGTNYAYSIQTTSYDSTDFGQPSFANPVLSGNLDGGANADSAGQSQPIYSISGLNPGGTSPAPPILYDGVGNLISYTDSVMGSWTYSYDSLNRLETGTASSGPYNGQSICWAYDSFGNRTAQTLQTSACPASEASVTPNTTYNLTNQVTGTSVNSAVNGFTYDAAGDVTNDNLNQYLYDAEGRICAVSSRLGGSTGYLYGADGARVAKGTITSWSCDPTLNGFTPTSDYVLDSSNEQVTELDMDSNPSAMAWQHTNVWADGKLLSTYDKDGLHFYFDDPLGTRRAQTDSAGVLEKTCQSLPYGDGAAGGCLPTPTEHFFTGKERDLESGNDYFGARYYASSVGRFMSPDWSAQAEPVPYAKPGDPQSLNLYAYVQNNPLRSVDLDGHFLQQGIGDTSNDPGRAPTTSNLTDAPAQQQQQETKESSTSSTAPAGPAKAGHKVLEKISSIVCSFLCAAVERHYQNRELAELDKLGKDTEKLEKTCNSSQCQLIVNSNFEFIEKESQRLAVPMAANLLELTNPVPDPAANGVDKAVGAGLGVATDSLKDATQH